MLKFKNATKLCVLQNKSPNLAGAIRLTGSAPSGAYIPSVIEDKLQVNEYFKPEIRADKPFSMILPPPNVTGTLHLGHALTTTVQDVIIRWHRMRGIETVWIPGIDHAGIATQVVVEKRLAKEKRQTRHDIGREAFQDEVCKWKREKATVIGQQLRRLGASLDWPYEFFTMDKPRSDAVNTAFIRLFEDSLIYRADYLVNWSCILQSAISDIEVEYVEIDGPTEITVPGYERPVKFGALTYFAYKFDNSDEELVVATTRPETMMGDIAVAVHPQDDRYSRHIGRNLWHPLRKQTIPIICDDFVDPTFGTGAVKVTPAHDHIDFEVGKRHSLPILSVIDETGRLTTACGQFAFTPRFQARDIILDELSKLQLLRGEKGHKMLVPVCSRSKDIIEMLVKPQWFLKSTEMAQKAIHDVREGTLRIQPKQFEKNWFNWLENIRDWCISRQLWWGHRIPAYNCRTKTEPKKTFWLSANNLDEAINKAATIACTEKDKLIVEQDGDVLDTWFSSALLPFSAFGWPQQGEDLSKYYPLSLMETGHDILFFWVARMVMLGHYLTGKPPFNNILLHGVLCDVHGRKMSKSLGNVVAPEDVINGSTLQQLGEGSKASHEAGILSSAELKRAIEGQKKMFPQGIPACGADALRFTLCSHNIKNHFIHFDVQECYTNKLFGNKIWQATKFANIWLEKSIPYCKTIPSIQELSPMDHWILSRLTTMLDAVGNSMQMFDFHIATAALKNFLYYEFCDIYLEACKRGLRQTDSRKARGHCWTLWKSLDTALRTLAPFMPKLAQHLHQHLILFPGERDSRYFPQGLELRNEELEEHVAKIMNTVIAIRRLKKTFNVTSKHHPQVLIITDSGLYPKYVETMEDLAGCHEITVSSQQDEAFVKTAVRDAIDRDTFIYLKISEELKRNLELDLKKSESKKGKILKELEKIRKMANGTNYKTKATQEEQESHAKRIAMLEEKLARINYIQSLCKQ